MTSVLTREQPHSITLPSGWAVPKFSLNQYVAWCLDASGRHSAFGRVIGINYEGKANPKGDGYFYNVIVDPECQCYQDWALADDDLGQVLETLYSYQLTALPTVTEQGA